MWRPNLSHLRKSRFNRQGSRWLHSAFEALEVRLALTWAGIPPTSITPPVGVSVAFDSQNNASGSATIASTEVDYYSLVATVTGNYVISTSTTFVSALDTVMGVFSSSGQRLAFNDDISRFDSDSQLTIGLTAGTRYYIGITNYSSSQQGSYNWTIDGPDGPPIPTIDLSGSQLSASNASGWGKTITVQAQVQNTGNTDSDTFLVRWYVSRDPTGATGKIALYLTDVDRASVRLDNLAAGQTETINVTLQLPSKPSGWDGSSFYLVMGTDVGSEVTETNENNNLGQVGSGQDHAAITIGNTSGTQPGGSFSIKLQMSGLTSSQKTIFQQAANRWKEVIVGDIPNATYRGETVDDILISASARNIDGVNGILGQAGPDALRSSSGLPYHGIMQFDSADLASMERSGLLFSVVLHEMGHVLGIGTIWDNKDLLSGEGGSNPIFTGTRATAAYNQLFGTNARGVPVENTGGSGTAYAHWRDSVFTTELMTGWAGPGTNLPMSTVTVASMADLGYSVNMAAADPYNPSTRARSAAQQASGARTAASIIAALESSVIETDRLSSWSLKESNRTDGSFSVASTSRNALPQKPIHREVLLLQPAIVDSIMKNSIASSDDEFDALDTSDVFEEFELAV